MEWRQKVGSVLEEDKFEQGSEWECHGLLRVVDPLHARGVQSGLPWWKALVGWESRAIRWTGGLLSSIRLSALRSIMLVFYAAGGWDAPEEWVSLNLIHRGCDVPAECLTELKLGVLHLSSPSPQCRPDFLADHVVTVPDFGGSFALPTFCGMIGNRRTVLWMSVKRGLELRAWDGGEVADKLDGPIMPEWPTPNSLGFWGGPIVLVVRPLWQTLAEAWILGWHFFDFYSGGRDSRRKPNHWDPSWISSTFWPASCNLRYLLISSCCSVYPQ
jgi:hypothetical protein